MLSVTADFLQAMDAHAIKYEYEGFLEQRDVVSVLFQGENFTDLRIRFFFEADEESLAMRVFNLCRFPLNKQLTLFAAANQLNRKFRFLKFCVDTDDNTVGAESDQILRDGAGQVALELLLRTVSICDEAYPDLMRAIWQD